MAHADKSISPFLRWAGGKRRLIEMITTAFPNDFNPSENRFHEPFLGGGAVSLHLGSIGSSFYLPGKHLFLNDINPDLIITYLIVRDNVDELIKELKSLSLDTSKDKFDELRQLKPKSDIKRAARFIYLNKTCFNGLWRVNSKGEFNVPWGKLKNPLIYSESNIRAVSARLSKSKITNLPYSSALEAAKKNDLVYLDPPYIPLTSTSSFSKYAKEDFGILDQYALAGVIEGLTRRGVRVILSNSDTVMTREVFGKLLNLYSISAGRSISANASSRGKINELIGVNFKLTPINSLKPVK